MGRDLASQGVIQVTDSAASIISIILGLAVFAIIVAVGWRGVQNRRILRLKGANGQETIIVAREGDDISSVVTTTETPGTEPAQAAASAPSDLAADADVSDPAPASEFRRIRAKS